MLKSKKKLLITIALLLVVTLAGSVAAYTLAGVGGNGTSEKIKTGVTQRASKLDGLVYMSNIDLIIQDSYTENYCFNIVHMIPYSMSKTDADYSGNAIDQYVSSGNFKDLVIDPYADKTVHDSERNKMKANTVRVITLPVNSTVKQDTVLSTLVSVKLPEKYKDTVSSYDEATYSVASLLSDADLLYIESPSKDSYTDSSAMSDSLYSYIKDEYYGINHKPIILDDITSSSDGNVSTDTTYRTVINAIADRYLYSPVFSWKQSQKVEDFLDGKDSSHFFAKKLNSKASGKVLRIRKSSPVDNNADSDTARKNALDSDWIANRIVNADKSALYYGNIKNYPGYDEWNSKPTEEEYNAMSADDKQKVDDAYAQKVSDWNAFTQTDDYKNGSLDSNKSGGNVVQPQSKFKESEEDFRKSASYFNIEDIDLSNATDAAALTADKLKSGYDFVIIEDSVISEKVSDEVKNAIVDLANGTQYIIFDAANVDPKGNGVVDTGNLYAELYSMLVSATTNEPLEPKRTLVVKNGFFGADALTEEGAKKITDILNGSSYRGSETNGRNGKKYRVLEIQPCYPIDTNVAEKQADVPQNTVNKYNGVKGDYYNNNPASIVAKAPEQLTSDTEQYYAFELSVAKIAYATGLKVTQIELDQMSTEEFISTKDVVLDTYDLVYIGGDFSALVPHNLENVFSAKGWGEYGSSQFNATLAASQKIATNYDMYTHTGGIVTLNDAIGALYGTYYEGGTAVVDVPDDIGYGVYREGGTRVSTSTLYNGNDLTATKYQELQDYIDAGMPIIFGSDVTSAYEAIYDKSELVKLSNNLIDPTSNMYAILDYAYKKYAPDKYSKIDDSVKNNSSLKSIYWGMDVSDSHIQREDNSEKIYGSTSYITRYTDSINEKIDACIDAAILRPTVQVRNAPKDYSLEDVTTHYSAEDGKMTISVSGLTNDETYQDIVVDLYVDKDGNGTFAEDEKVDSKNIVNKGTPTDLTYQFEQSDFYGLISWKVVASTVGTNQTVAPRDVRTGFAYYKRDDNVEKKEVRVLQVMPVESAEAAYKNTNSRGDSGNNATLYMCTDCQWVGRRIDYNVDTQSTGEMNVNKVEAGDDGGGNKWGQIDGTSVCGGSAANGIYLGKHKHNFGIIEYDTNGPQQGTHDKANNGSENYSSNFAQDLTEDYDFSMDILYLDELNDIASVVKANGSKVTTKDSDGKDVTTYEPVKVLDANGNLNKNGVSRKNEDGDIVATSDMKDMTWVEYYQALADKYYDQYERAEKKAAKSDAKKNLDSILTDFKATIPETGKKDNGNAFISGPEAVQYWIDAQLYSYYFIYVKDFQKAAYKSNYAEWVKLNDEVVENYNLYKKYSRYACTEDNWLGSNYDMVVLGFANNFNDQDLTVEECNQIKTYVQDGGTVLLTHDATTKYADPKKGSFNLTTQLRTTFGQDRYHVKLDTAKNPELGKESTIHVDYKTQNIYITAPDNNIYYNWPDGKDNIAFGPVTTTNKDVTVKVVLDVNGVTPNDSSKGYYPVADYTYDQNSSVQNGTIKITVEFYDTQEDLTNGKKASIPDNKASIAILADGDNNLNKVGDVALSEYKNGSFTKAISSGETSANAKLKYPFLIFDSDKVGTRNKYYISPISIKQRDGEALAERIIWQSEMENIPNIADTNKKNYLSLIGLTDAASMFRTSDNGSSIPYKYARYNWYAMAQNNYTGNGGDDSEKRGTDKAQQVNKGIVTTYPYGLGESLLISATHSQSFALDMENSNMTVWYTLAATNTDASGGGGSGSDGRPEETSSLFAASPKDGMDSYFLYTFHSGKGTVHYCGAGHSLVTGSGKKNNDERKLYMNIAVDAVRNSASKPKITLYDKKHKEVTENSKNGLRVDSEGNYIYTLDDVNGVPEFDFDVRFNELSGLTDVYMFYDLNYDCPASSTGNNKYVADYSDRYTDDTNHVLIHHYTSDLSKHSEETITADSGANPNGCSLLDDENYLTKLKNSNPLELTKKNLMAAEVRDIVPNTKDTLVFKASGNETTKMRVPKDENKLALNVAKEEGAGAEDPAIDYFAPYNNYTYLVIYAKDGKGKTAHVRIKIMTTQRLFELTDNTTYSYPQYYFAGVKYTLDVTDRTRFNI